MSADIQRLSAALAGRYTVDRELGAGGMSTVYLAHDVKHDRDVTIKVRMQSGKLMRVEASGALTLVGMLPRGCNTAVVDRTGTQVACKTAIGSGDVWLATPAGQ